MELPALSTPLDSRPIKRRSAVTNGTRLHVQPVGDTAWSRRFKDLLVEIVSDVRSANPTLSEGQRQLARRAATLSLECEKMEVASASGAAIDLDSYGQLTDRLGRCFQRLGLKRQAKDVSPSLGDLMLADIEERRREAEERVVKAADASEDESDIEAADDQVPADEIAEAEDGHAGNDEAAT